MDSRATRSWCTSPALPPTTFPCGRRGPISCRGLFSLSPALAQHRADTHRSILQNIITWYILNITLDHECVAVRVFYLPPHHINDQFVFLAVEISTYSLPMCVITVHFINCLSPQKVTFDKYGLYIWPENYVSMLHMSSLVYLNKAFFYIFEIKCRHSLLDPFGQINKFHWQGTGTMPAVKIQVSSHMLLAAY